ncbi:hypothetical protein ACFVYT_25015 [Streptomyces sp. NPDC058290]|uniref:hypothetical protein n=1 Tax=Streptomyces sp. NPDC058290 TaxID=3346426 RepID=UPI0036F163C5
MAITVGSVEVDVIPNTQGIYARLREGLVPAATRAGNDAGAAAGRAFGPAMQREVGAVGLRVGQQIGEQIADRVTAAIRGALRDGIAQGGREARASAVRQGEETGGAFSRALKARLEAAFRSLPKINIDADTSEADADLQALRVRMETLAGKRIGIDIDAQTARAEVADIEEQLRRLGAAHPNVTVQADTARARAELAAVREEIDRVSATTGHIHLETDGTLGQRLRAQVQAAEAALPNINVTADTSPAEAEISSLRAQLTAMRDQRIGIDVDATAALARITEVQARLQRLAASDADVAVRVDAAAAVARLASVQALVSALDGQTARVNVDTSGALSAILHLTVALGGLAVIPAVPILAAGIGAIGSAAVASAAGVGALAAVAAPAFIGIAGALQAQKAAQDASTAASQRGAQAGAQASSRALQMAGAQQALAAAQRNAASQIASARDQVAQAARNVGDAEKQLATAQKDARQAQLDLVAARQEAARQLEDLSSRYADAQLSVREAELSLAEAEQRRREVEKDPKSTTLEKQRAALAVDQATQRLKQQTVETRRLAEEQTTASKTGVEGTQVVKQAQDRLAKSQETVVDRTRGVADAQAAVAKAQENVAKVSAQAADSIASAQRQIASASASAAGGVDQAAIAQANYQAALDKLTPSARGTFDAFQSLRTAFKGWSESLQPAVMPLFTRAIEGIKNSLPGLTPFVLAAATAIGILQDKVSAGFKSPWWQSFRDDLAKAVVPATVGLGVAIGNVFKTLGGIVDAFLPHMDEISKRMREITGRWATWATGLKGTDKFTGFLAYSAEQGPILAKVIGDIGAAIFQISRAVSPLSGPVLGTLGAVLTAVASIAQTLPWLIQLMYGAWVVTKLWTLALIVFNAVMDANPIVLIIIGIIALVAAVIYAYKHWGWFHDAVDAAWRGIQAGAKYVWSILQPILAGIWTALQAVGTAAMWLWENGIRPAFEGIWLAARVLWAIVVVSVVVPIMLAFRALAAVATWLYENGVRPAFQSFADQAMWLWTVILRPVFGWIGQAAMYLWREWISPAWESMKVGTRSLGDRFRELWESYIKPIFGWIADKAGWLYEVGIRPWFDRIRQAVNLVKDAFVLAKDGIKTAWDQLVEITRKPVQFIVETVYNSGIVPVWNAVAKIAGLGQLEKMKFASGGSVFGAGTATSDSIPALLSNGEHVWTAREVQAAGGHSVVESLRQRALRSGSTFATGGAVGIPRFAEGGVVDWLSGKAQQLGGAVMTAFDFMSNPGKGWDVATQVLRDKIGENLTGTQWAQALSQLPLAMLRGLKTKIVKAAEDLIGGGAASGSVAAAMGFAKSQAGKPYQWGGAGDPSWDCSGFMSGIQKVILGQSPLGRLWSTFSFQGDTAPAGWRRNLRSPFMIGITNNGVGHTAGTLAGMNVESRGGDGVIVGSRARGYNNGLFQDWYGFAPALGTYDSGGYLQPGMNLAYNGTGRPEPVLTTGQLSALTSSRASRPADQRSYNITLQGSRLTAAEQVAELTRHLNYTT